MSPEQDSSPLHRMLAAPTSRPDVPRLVHRRRITWVAAAIFGIVMAAALSIGAATSAADGSPDDLWSTVGGFAVLAAVVCLIVVVQYTVRIAYLRRAAEDPHRSAPLPVLDDQFDDQFDDSAAAEPLRRLRAARALLVRTLPLLERPQPGIGELADRTWVALEQAAARVRLMENLEAGPVAGPPAPGEPDPRAELRELVVRLARGVEQYAELAAQAAVAADGLRTAGPTTAQLRDATDRLAGLAQGLREVERINGAR